MISIMTLYLNESQRQFVVVRVWVYCSHLLSAAMPDLGKAGRSSYKGVGTVSGWLTPLDDLLRAALRRVVELELVARGYRMYERFNHQRISILFVINPYFPAHSLNLFSDRPRSRPSLAWTTWPPRCVQLVFAPCCAQLCSDN